MKKQSGRRGEHHEEARLAGPAKAVRSTSGSVAKPAARGPQQVNGAAQIARSDEFRPLKDEIVKADARGRLTVGSEASEKQFRVLINADGQILLDPVVVIPEREAWLFRNLQAATSVLRGIEQAKQGELRDAGSFASYAEDED